MTEGAGEKLTRHQAGLPQAKKGQEVKGKDALGHPHQGLQLLPARGSQSHSCPSVWAAEQYGVCVGVEGCILACAELALY